MKKNQLTALWVVACSLFFSCHKPDFPPNTKACQIIEVRSAFTESGYGRTFKYGYNSKRLMDTLTAGPDFVSPPPARLHIGYNAQLLPVSITYSGITNKFIYQNGRIARIDQTRGDNLYHTIFTFTYDSYGRVIKRSSASDTVRWEYLGSSRNYIKRISLSVGAPAEQTTIFEYEYDHKINPLATWPNLPLNPILYDLPDLSGNEFEPIPENNWIYQSRKARNYNDNGNYFTFQEIFYTYEYDNNYPVKAQVRDLHHSPGNPDQERLSQTTFTYDCASKGTSF